MRWKQTAGNDVLFLNRYQNSTATIGGVIAAVQFTTTTDWNEIRTAAGARRSGVQRWEGGWMDTMIRLHMEFFFPRDRSRHCSLLFDIENGMSWLRNLTTLLPQ